MVTIDTIRQSIRKQRYNGISYAAIAHEWDIKPSMVEYIEKHEDYEPSARMREKLGITPTRKQLADRARRKAQRGELERLRAALKMLSDERNYYVGANYEIDWMIPGYSSPWEYAAEQLAQTAKDDR